MRHSFGRRRTKNKRSNSSFISRSVSLIERASEECVRASMSHRRSGQMERGELISSCVADCPCTPSEKWVVKGHRGVEATSAWSEKQGVAIQGVFICSVTSRCHRTDKADIKYPRNTSRPGVYVCRRSILNRTSPPSHPYQHIRAKTNPSYYRPLLLCRFLYIFVTQDIDLIPRQSIEILEEPMHIHAR